MSHDGTHGGGDGYQTPPVATTGTITMGVKLLVVLGVLVSIMQGSFVGFSSAFGRVWPAANSAKVPLPPSKF